MTTGSISRLFIALVLLFACYPKANAQEDDSKNKSFQKESGSASALSTLWENARNDQDPPLMDLYTIDAVKIDSNDSIWSGSEQIYAHYEIQAGVSFVRTAYSIDANIHRGITYEVNFYKPKNSKIVVQLVIYETSGDQKLRAFEFEATRPILNIEGKHASIIEKINKRRAEWMALCNAHDVTGLVYDLYSHHTLYYNHRPLVKGRQALVREYSYMNSDQYQLTLAPSFQTIVNDSTVFEIGQCQGSYNGKYILIWKKEEDGQWRIFIDSNI